VPQELSIYENLGTEANLVLFGALYGLSGALLAERVAAALALVGLADRAKDKPSTFSGGMKRRLNIAAALVHDPDILIFDEPTVGVDPQSRNAIFDNLEELRRRGKALLYTTHYMEEAERLCDRIVIVDHGKVVASDTLAGIERLLPATQVLEIEVDGLVDLGALRRCPASTASTQEGALLRAGVADLGRARRRCSPRSRRAAAASAGSPRRGPASKTCSCR
jgi:ABC-2 type transport system ATP-binding protein